MEPSRQRGQATTEYVAIVAVVALILAGAATAVAAPSIPRSIAHTVRKGICIVVGNVCDSADAKARGLEPCVVSNWDRSRTGGVSVAVIHIGGNDNWIVARRSDGTRMLSYLPSFDLKGSVGAGLSLGPRIHIGAEASAGIGFGAGKAWELPNEAALQRFIKRIDAGYARQHTPWGKLGTPPAKIHFQEGGVPAEANAGVKHDGSLVAGAELSARVAAGHRTGPDGTTWYFNGGTDLAAALAGKVAGFDGRGQVVVEWHPHRPSTLTLRTTTGNASRVTETVSRLDLTDAADEALAQRWALGDPASMALAVRGLASRIAERAVTQRFTYAQEETTKRHGLAIKVGLALGVDRSETLVTRKLVGAELVTRDGTVQREDCLALAAG